MKFLLMVLAAAILCPIASAKDKALLDSAYQDAMLVKFVTVTTGTSCSHKSNTTGTVDATTDADGNTDGTVRATTSGSTNCSNDITRYYTISVGEQTFVIEPEMTKGQKGAALATMGWSAVFAKQSVLANQLPGVHILVRSDAAGLWVKVGKRESRFRMVDAQ